MLDTAGFDKVVDDGVSTVANETHLDFMTKKARPTEVSDESQMEFNVARQTTQSTFGSSFLATTHRPTSERFDQTMHDFHEVMQKQREKGKTGRKANGRRGVPEQDLLEQLAII